MKTLYIVFDQLPKKQDGGLVATYIDFVSRFKDRFPIKIVSVFANGGNNIEAFDDIDIINLSSFVVDNRFFRIASYIKAHEFKRARHALVSAFRFFSFIPLARKKTKKLFSENMVLATAPAAAMFISNNVRFILEVHTSFDYFWGKNALGRMQSALAAKPALTLFRNKYDATKASKFFRADYIYNGVASPNAKSIESHTRTPHSALFVGRLNEQKNPLMLLDIAQKVRKTIPDLRLDIYGIGEMEEKLKAEIACRDLGDTVTLKGFIDDKSIYSHYEQFWFTSKLEGFGLVLVEAMANRTAVITTEWGEAVKEIVRNGETGYIVNDCASFVERAVALFSNVDDRTRITESAYEEFEQRFSLVQNTARWEKILPEVYPDLT